MPARSAGNPHRPEADFDHDGYPDLAVGSDGGRHSYVAVLYGGPHGTGGAHRRLLPGRAFGVGEEDDSAPELAAGDFDGDGFADLAVTGSGSVSVAWGGAKGLRHPVELWHGTKAYVTEQPAAGDFDGDGHTDLVFGQGARIRLLRGPFTREGPVRRGATAVDLGYDDLERSLAAGDMTGDGRDDLVVFSSYEDDGNNAVFRPGTPHGLGRARTLPTGGAGTVGDVDGDGYGDLVMVYYPHAYAGGPRASLRVVYGSPHGPDTSRETPAFDEDSLGVPGSVRDRVTPGTEGNALTAGDMDGDGYTDVAAGVLPDTPGRDAREGKVLMLHGSCTELTGSGARAYAPGEYGLPESAAPEGRFGIAVQAADTDADGSDDLAVGSPAAGYPTNGDGELWTLPGGRHGPRTRGAHVYAPRDLGAHPRTALGSHLLR